MKILKQKISDLDYYISKKWTSFTYIFRKPYYRFRLFKRFMKYSYYGSWEMVDPIMEYPFECFCEFYESTFIKGEPNHNWNADRWHRKAKKEMNYLYAWWTKDRYDRQEEMEVVLDEWSLHHCSWWQDEKVHYRYCCTETKYSRYLNNLYHQLEQNFEKEKEKNFIRLIKIRGYLWS